MNKTIIEPEKTERLRQLADVLQMEIRGQHHIIPRVVSVLQRGELGLSKAGRPRGSFLFLGPTGVGKTELTQVFTGNLFGMEKLVRYDMSEFQTQEARQTFHGRCEARIHGSAAESGKGISERPPGA